MPSVEGDEQTSQPQPQGNTDASAQSNNPDQIEELESILNSNLVQMVPEDGKHFNIAIFLFYSYWPYEWSSEILTSGWNLKSLSALKQLNMEFKLFC